MFEDALRYLSIDLLTDRNRYRILRSQGDMRIEDSRNRTRLLVMSSDPAQNARFTPQGDTPR